MKQSLLFAPTLKEAPKDADVKSHKLMARAGLIKQTAAGIYTYLPLARRAMNHIERIIREELDQRDCSELLMPALQPRDLWEESGRWGEYGPELFRLKDRKDRDFCLGPTHEEVITQVTRDYINTYKKLPLALYQIQTKFRDELRPRFALMRGREFIMKDLYTFHTDDQDLDLWYDKIMKAYTVMFERMGLQTKIVSSDTGQIGGKEADEFMVMSEVGEDTISYCDTCQYGANQEFSGLHEKDPCPKCDSGTIKEAKGIEVGNIFKLGTKYSESMNAYYNDKDGQKTPVVMGCYGLGISRTLMAVVEQNSQEHAMVWPKEVAPFYVHVIPLKTNQEEDMAAAQSIYKTLNQQYDVLIDDRDERPGIKFKDADLIGIPYRVVIGKDLKDGLVEFTNRYTGEKKLVKVAEISQHIHR